MTRYMETDYPYKKTPLVPWMAVIVFFCALSTVIVWRININFIQEKNDRIFQGIIQKNRTSLFALLNTYDLALTNARAFYMKTDNMSRDVWRDYVARLNVGKSYPGINGVGYIRRVRWDDLQSFIDQERHEFPSFTPYPQTDLSEKFVITYIEPYDRNVEAVGLDVAFEENRRNVAILAMITGETAITKRILLVQDKTRQPGFLIFQPLYSPGPKPQTTAQRIERTIGWIYAPFVGSNFIKSIQNPAGHYTELQVYDGPVPSAMSLIFDTATDHPHVGRIPKHKYQETITIMQQPWTLVWSSTIEFDAAMESSEPDLILLGGFSLTACLMILFYVIAQRARVIRELVHEKTQQIYRNRDLLYASEQTFRAAMENSPSGMALLHPDGRWMKVNKRLCDILGYSEQEVFNVDYKRLLTGQHADDYKKHIQELRDGKIQFFEIKTECLHKTGRVLWILLNVSLIRNKAGEPQFLIVQVNDITEGRKLERMKEDFITVVSHELRTPVTSLELSLSLLKSNLNKTLSIESSRLFDTAMRNSRRLISLVNDILDLHKIANDAIAYIIAPCSVDYLMRRAIQENSVYGERYDVRFVYNQQSQTTAILCDPERVLQILANFMSNAAKFSQKGQLVTLSVQETLTSVRLCVEDDGIGIPDQYKDNIFKKFGHVASAANKKIEGTGLGLYISKEMAESMGGSVGFESEYGKGSVFWCAFPRADNHQK